MLPRIDGYELLRYLQTTGTPAIFVTARTAVADRVRGLRLGAEDYILNPLPPPSCWPGWRRSCAAPGRATAS